jgi:MtN3 and saliva related transmembrane protein
METGGIRLITVIGIAASLFSAVCSVPQLIKIIKEKEAGSISIKMMIILIIGLLLWTCYGILLKNIILIISNAFSVIINILVLSFVLYYKNKKKAA